MVAMAYRLHMWKSADDIQIIGSMLPFPAAHVSLKFMRH